MTSEVTDRILTIPNLITLLRLLLVPLFYVLLVVAENNVAAFLVFGVAASTDFVDGKVARATGSVSKLGQQFDPLVDRILIVVGVIAVFVMGRVPLWILFLLVLRDAIMLALTIYLRTQFNQAFKVIFIGKLTTAVIMFGFCLLILNWPFVPALNFIQIDFLPGWGESPACLGIWVLYIGVLLSVTSGFIYVRKVMCIGASKPAHLQNEYGNGRRTEQRSSHKTRVANMGNMSNRNNGTKRASVASGSYGSKAQSFVRDVQLPPANSYGSKQREGLHKTNGRHFSARFFLISALIAIVVVFGGGWLAIDVVGNWGVIHNGVSVQDVAIGGMSRQAAASRLDEKIGAQISQEPLLIFANDAAKNVGENEQTVDFGGSVGAYEETSAEKFSSWRVDAGSIGMRLDTATITQKAYDIGRGVDFLTSRITCNTGGITLTTDYSFSASRLNDLENMITDSLGNRMINASVVYENGTFLAVAGVEGYEVSHADFVRQLADGFTSTATNAATTTTTTAATTASTANIGGDISGNAGSSSVIVPMATKMPEISLDAATELAAHTQEQTAVSVKLSYEDKLFEVPIDTLRSWISVSVEYGSNSSVGSRSSTSSGNNSNNSDVSSNNDNIKNDSGNNNKGDDENVNADSSIIVGNIVSTAYLNQGNDRKASLIAHFDASKIESSINTVIGDLKPGVLPIDAKFVNDGGSLKIIESKDGIGIDFTWLADELDQIVFAADAGDKKSDSDIAIIPIGVIQPKLTTFAAQSYKLSDKIAEFTTYYWARKENRTHNVHLAADYINGSLIASGGIWSFNERVGECTLERGFKADLAIINDEYQDEIGGGVCQVASTVFNSAYEAGLPIEQRINHSLYLESYPDGRDAAIAWPYADLKFRNDTNDWILITMSYDDTSVTATLWGVSPGYSVVSESSDWVKGKEFKTIEREVAELPAGTERTKTEGIDGKSITVTRTVYDKNGTVLRKETFSSKYEPTNKIVEQGPKKEDPEPALTDASAESSANATSDNPESTLDTGQNPSSLGGAAGTSPANTQSNSGVAGTMAAGVSTD